MIRTFLAMSLCFIGGLASSPALAAKDLFTADCSSILITDGRISIDSDQDLDALKKVPRFKSAVGYPTAQLIGPPLTGRTVQVEVWDGTKVFVRGTVSGSRDEWKSFDLKEQETGAVLQITAEHPVLGARRVELLDQDLPRELFEDPSLIQAFEDRFDAEAKDLKLNGERTKYESKMSWYRRWNGRNLRTTLYDRQDKLARMEYLLRLNRIDEALALIRMDVDNSKIPAIAINKAVAQRAALRATMTSNAYEQRRLIALDERIEERLREQGKLLGTHYGDFRAEIDKLEKLSKNENNVYPEKLQQAAVKMKSMITVVNSSSALTPALVDITEEPDLAYVKRAFFAQKYSVIEKLRRDLWAERITFTWMILNKVTGQEFFRRNIDALTEKLPAALRSVLNGVRKGKRDMDARRFDIPQIERIAHLDGDAAFKAEELRKVFYGDADSRLLKTFSRISDREEQELWKTLLEAAPEDFAAVMREHEKIGDEWGQFSKHYHQTQMNMVAAVISAGGVGSGFAYYKFGAQDTWLWQALDFLVQLLPFT